MELAVANKTDEAVFVSFDGDITKLTNIGVAESGHIHVNLNLRTRLNVAVGFIYMLCL